jgi:hypothetical protein
VDSGLVLRFRALNMAALLGSAIVLFEQDNVIIGRLDSLATDLTYEHSLSRWLHSLCH